MTFPGTKCVHLITAANGRNMVAVRPGCFFFQLHLELFFYKSPFLNSSLQPSRLGSWGSWEGGEGPMKYSIMKFTGGQVSGLGY